MSSITVDIKWKKALTLYSRLEHSKYGKVKVLEAANVLFKDQKVTTPFTKAIVAIETALQLNNIDDVKVLLQEPFATVE